MYSSKHLSNLLISDSIVSKIMRSAVMLALLFITAAPANAMLDDNLRGNNHEWAQIDEELVNNSPNIPPTHDWKGDEEDDFWEDNPVIPDLNDKSYNWTDQNHDTNHPGDENLYNNFGVSGKNKGYEWNQGGLDEELYDNGDINKPDDKSYDWNHGNLDEDIYHQYGIPDNGDDSGDWTEGNDEDYNNFINQGASKDEFLNSFPGYETLIGTISTSTGNDNNAAWYGMDGKKLNDMPTETGMYINNGQQVYLIIE